MTKYEMRPAHGAARCREPRLRRTTVEMGFVDTLRQTNRDIWVLWLSVVFRMAAFALTNQVLTLFLKQVGIDEKKIGWFMTLTLVGDVVISYFLTWYADALGRRNVMLLGSLMMAAAGAVFFTCSRFEWLLLAAILGVISPSGDETGPFKSVEEACLAHLTPHSHRPEIFAMYGLLANVGSSIGSLAGGLVVEILSNNGVGLERSYRLVFAVYSAVGFAKFVFMLFLTDKCEVHRIEYGDENGEESEGEDEDSELRPLVASTTLSPASKHHLYPLLAVFMLDSLGYGFMPGAWVVYYFRTVLKMTAAGVGILFFFCSQIDSFSSIPSAIFARTLGPVKAMFATQAPSAVFFLGIGLTSLVPVACTLLVLYFATLSMDVVPRQILLTSIMPPQDLTKVMGIVNIAKTFARCVGPIFTGKLATHGKLAYGFFINGACVLTADFLLATNFLHMDADILAKQSNYERIQ